MSSLLRRQTRKIKRTAGSFELKERQHRTLPDGGYAVVHPTKGWRTFSAPRLRAQFRLAQQVEAINRRMGRA